MSYGNLFGFMPGPDTSVPKQDPKPSSVPEAPRRDTSADVAEKTPADYAADAYSMLFGGTKNLAEKGVKVKMQMPCGDCIMEAARSMTRG
jgi:hypothetical protein